MFCFVVVVVVLLACLLVCLLACLLVCLLACLFVVVLGGFLFVSVCLFACPFVDGGFVCLFCFVLGGWFVFYKILKRHNLLDLISSALDLVAGHETFKKQCFLRLGLIEN